jgi:hypothetical protein
LSLLNINKAAFPVYEWEGLPTSRTKTGATAANFVAYEGPHYANAAGALSDNLVQFKVMTVIT